MKNESVKKSLEESKNVLEEKRKMAKRKIHVYNNCYELRSRAIKQVFQLHIHKQTITQFKRTNEIKNLYLEKVAQ